MPMPRRVLIVGFYGVMNAGDELLQMALSHHLREHHLTFTGQLPSIDVIHQFDLLVLGGGSLWPQHQFFQLGSRYAKRLRIPFMVLGVSARSFDAKVAAHTRELVERAVLFHVRDRQTAEWIDHPKLMHGSDLFWSMPWCGDEEIDSIRRDGVAIAARSDALENWPLAAIDRALKPLGGPAHAWPFYYGHAGHDRGGQNDFAALRQHYGSAPASFSLEPMRRSAVVLTMRYHGLLCALRAGRPVLVTDVNTKLRQFCLAQGLSSNLVADIRALPQAASALAANFDAALAQTQRVREYLLNDGRRLAAVLANRLEQLPHPNRAARTPLQRLTAAGLKSMLSRVV